MRIERLPYEPCRITSKFGKRNTGIPGASTDHKGIDIGVNRSKPYTATDGGPVVAVLDGKVRTSTFNQYRGYYVMIDHGKIDGQSVYTLYQHLKKKGLAVGTSVKAGDEIGTMGNTGVGAQLHLHFEIRLNGVPVDPEPYIHQLERDMSESGKSDMTDEYIRQVVREEIQKTVNGADTKVTKYGAAEMQEAKAAGITDGTRPGGLATREQAAIMAYRAMKIAEKSEDSAVKAMEAIQNCAEQLYNLAKTLRNQL